jgi:hypothetical protein
MLVLVVACSAGEVPEEWAEVDLVDVGHACLYTDTEPDALDVFEGSAPEATLAPGLTVQVKYASTECLSSSCTRNADVVCSAVVYGTDIVVYSTATWEQRQGEVTCTDDCGILDATCEVGVLKDGDHSLTLGSGGAPASFVVPSTASVCASSG